MEQEQEKQEYIAKQIKPIDEDIIFAEWQKLREIGKNADQISARSKIGNNLVDYFTFEERLKTKGKYNCNFYEFVERIEEFKKKKFIQNMLEYYKDVKNKNNTKNEYVVLKEVYNICISSINIFRPIQAMEVYAKYKPTRILDFSCGWGGRLVGACALDIPHYIGIDINQGLKPGYDKMIAFLKKDIGGNSVKRSKTEIEMIYKDSLQVDYSSLDYDMVFTSPPYYLLEKYPNNVVYSSKPEMNEIFYKPLFQKTWTHLKPGGTYCLNVNKEIYDACCFPILGEATESFPMKKSQRQNKYMEWIYVWTKPILPSLSANSS